MNNDNVPKCKELLNELDPWTHKACTGNSVDNVKSAVSAAASIAFDPWTHTWGGMSKAVGVS